MSQLAYQIDINCDMGESFGLYKIGQDELLFPYISSCNIACGFHGGDPLHIESTIKNAIKHGVQIGAHPSYPDLQGFGRRAMKIPPRELKAIIKYQVAALKGLTEAEGGTLSYVKPHGALYNTAANNNEEGIIIFEAIQEIDENLAIMGLAGSEFEKLVKQNNCRFIREGFADRKYLSNGLLMPRNKPEALIKETQTVLEQVRNMIFHHKVATEKGMISLIVDSICIHGDNPYVLDLVKSIQSLSQVEGFIIQSSLKRIHL